MPLMGIVANVLILRGIHDSIAPTYQPFGDSYTSIIMVGGQCLAC
jgi:hypothetical protein